MEAININLLPVEDALRQKKEGKFRLIQSISVFLLLTLLFLATIGFILRFLQSKDISKVESAANSAESEVAFPTRELGLQHGVAIPLLLSGHGYALFFARHGSVHRRSPIRSSGAFFADWRALQQHAAAHVSMPARVSASCSPLVVIGGDDPQA